MKKHIGKAQQIRGYRRTLKSLNRKKLRNKSDISKNPGDKFVTEYLLPETISQGEEHIQDHLNEW